MAMHGARLKKFTRRRVEGAAGVLEGGTLKSVV